MPYKALKTKAWLIIICAVLCAICIIGEVGQQNPLLLAAVCLILAAMLFITLHMFSQDLTQHYSLRQYFATPLSTETDPPDKLLGTHTLEIICGILLCFFCIGMSKVVLQRPTLASCGAMIYVILTAGHMLYDIKQDSALYQGLKEGIIHGI